MTVSTEGRSFLVASHRAREMRRRLGPTAWVVLETLLARSTGPVERCEAVATTRTLANDLGLAKDTVARALVKLRRAGVVNARQTRAGAGMFATGFYVIVVPSCFVLDEQIDVAPAPTKRPCATRPIGSQLALSLDD